MPKPRTPSNVLKLKGSFKEHPDRAKQRSNEPKTWGPIGDPSPSLPDNVKAAWRELVKYAHAGTLCEADRPFMEYAAQVWARIKTWDGTAVDVKLGVRFESIIGRLGMSPADRSRVSVIKPDEEKSPYAEFG